MRNSAWELRPGWLTFVDDSRRGEKIAGRLLEREGRGVEAGGGRRDSRRRCLFVCLSMGSVRKGVERGNADSCSRRTRFDSIRFLLGEREKERDK